MAHISLIRECDWRKLQNDILLLFLSQASWVLPECDVLTGWCLTTFCFTFEPVYKSNTRKPLDWQEWFRLVAITNSRPYFLRHFSVRVCQNPCTQESTVFDSIVKDMHSGYYSCNYWRNSSRAVEITELCMGLLLRQNEVHSDNLLNWIKLIFYL